MKINNISLCSRCSWLHIHENFVKFPTGSDGMVKKPPAIQETQVWSLGQKIPWRRKWLPTPVFLPGECGGQKSLVGCSPWVCKDSDRTKLLTLSLSISVYFQGVHVFMATHSWKLHQIFTHSFKIVYMRINFYVSLYIKDFKQNSKTDIFSLYTMWTLNWLEAEAQSK